MKPWLKYGLLFGGVMFLMTEVLVDKMLGGEIAWIQLLYEFPLWIIAGLLWGYLLKVTKVWEYRTKSRLDQPSNNTEQ